MPVNTHCAARPERHYRYELASRTPTADNPAAFALAWVRSGQPCTEHIHTLRADGTLLRCVESLGHVGVTVHLAAFDPVGRLWLTRGCDCCPVRVMCATSGQWLFELPGQLEFAERVAPVVDWTPGGPGLFTTPKYISLAGTDFVSRKNLVFDVLCGDAPVRVREARVVQTGDSLYLLRVDRFRLSVVAYSLQRLTPRRARLAERWRRAVEFPARYYSVHAHHDPDQGVLVLIFGLCVVFAGTRLGSTRVFDTRTGSQPRGRRHTRARATLDPAFAAQ